MHLLNQPKNKDIFKVLNYNKVHLFNMLNNMVYKLMLNLFLMNPFLPF